MNKIYMVLFVITFTLAGCMLMTASPALAQSVWIVDDDAPDDPGPGDPTASDPLENGSPGHPFDAIQEAINASADGDYVGILNGVYTGDGNRGLDFHGKEITMVTEGGPDDCFIDAEGADRGFHFHSGETGNARLGGLTIMNGYAGDDGGAIFCESGSSPLIFNCIIKDSSALRGGGIFCDNSNATIKNCLIENNTSVGGGGGIRCQASNGLEIRGCTIRGNSSQTHGGGIYSGLSDMTVTGCEITGNNAAGGKGGGIRWYYGNPTISDCKISGNSANDGGGLGGAWGDAEIRDCIITGNDVENQGGGIYCNFECSPILVNSAVAGNIAENHGGGISSQDACVFEIRNCLITYNFSGANGGGLYCLYDCEYDIQHSTIANNAAPGNGGGIFGYSYCYIRIDSTIIWANQASAGATIHLEGNDLWDISWMDLSYSDLAGSIVVGQSVVNWGPGMLITDPMFVNGPQSPFYLSQIAAGQPSDSFCVNTGDPASGMITGTTRTDEVQDSGRVDMGYHHVRFTSTLPFLRSGAVSPETGYYGTRYAYSVKYFDEGGNPPALIYVHIDGVDYAMNLDSGFPSNGWYLYETRDIPLDVPHTYAFYAETGQGKSCRFPDTGTLSGPSNNAPELYLSGTPAHGEWMTAEVWGVAGGLWAVAGSSEPGPLYVPATGLTFNIGPGDLFWIKKIENNPLFLDDLGYGSRSFPIPYDLTPGTKYVQGATKKESFWAKTNRVTVEVVP